MTPFSKLFLPVTLAGALSCLACGSSSNAKSGDAGPPDVAIDVQEPDAHPAVNVTMNAYTPGGEGANTQETYLNVTNVKSGNFGKLFTRTVDGDVYAQPLYMSQLKMNDGKTHNVVFVATEHDTVFAFDADDTTASQPLWKKPVGTSTPLPSPYLDWEWSAGAQCNEFAMREVGITSTPVIDPKSQTLYVVALNIDSTHKTPGGTCLSNCASGTAVTMKCDAPRVVLQLHALDLATGAEKLGGPVDVEGTYKGSGGGSTAGVLTFDPGVELQRPALLLSGGAIYFSTGSFNDAGIYHGWLFAFDATSLKQTGIWNDTPNGVKGGIWQSGRGAIADAQGNVYLVTGQGTFDVGTGGEDYGDTVVKFAASTAPKLSSVKDYFSQFLSDYMGNNFPNEWDDDFGSAGATLIPNTSLLLASGKLGIAYLLDTNKLGEWDPMGDNVVQKLRITWRTSKTPGNCDEITESHIFATPIAWTGPDGTHVYVWSENDYLRDYLLDGSGKLKDSGTLCFCNPWVVGSGPGDTIAVTDPNCASPNGQGPVGLPENFPGGALAVSSNGTTAGTGLLWATYQEGTGKDGQHQVQPGVLAAYDAVDVSQPLWTSSANPGDALGNWAKFNPPTVANGKVYVATFSNELVAYGLTGGR
jgi:hypothetical protein